MNDKDYFVHSSSLIDNEVRIGEGTKIWHYYHIMSGARIGKNCKIGQNVFNPRSAYPRYISEYRKTLVKKEATIGANATIICGVTLGRSAFIGAGTVVTEDTPHYGLVYGNPAKVKGWMCECGGKLGFDNNLTKCKVCGSEYKILNGNKVIHDED